MNKQLKLSLLLSLLMTYIILFFSTTTLASSFNLNILTSDIVNTGNLRQEDVYQGYVNIGQIEFLITTSVNISWKLEGKVIPLTYPGEESPDLDVIEFYDGSSWKPLHNELITDSEGITTNYYAIQVRYSFIEGKNYCSGNYSFKIEFDLIKQGNG